jgi:HB1/ASXL restriction endonuclease-like protein with HTH domain
MNTEKLTEALVEMKHQRALLDAAIKNIEGVLDSLGGGDAQKSAPRVGRRREQGSYIELAQAILAEHGGPLHIKDLAAKISEKRGRNIPRASVESSIVRHIKAYGNNSTIIKVHPAIFGLRAWKTLFVKQPNQTSAA